MVKIDLVTGFLGSGKTTFIKKYAKYRMDCGERICILENDHGAVNVDMLLMNELRSENCELEMVAGGCDYDCHKRRFKTKLISMAMSGYDRVIVEPSGIFEADEFFDTLCEEPLDIWYGIGNVIAIVDAGLEEDLSEQSEYLLASQAANAGRIVMSHVHEASAEDIRRTLAHLKRALEAAKCRMEFEGLIVCKEWEDFTETDWKELSSCGYRHGDYVKMPLDHDHDYQSLYFMNLRVPEERLEGMIRSLLEDPACGRIFRIKGFMETGKDRWVQMNATHRNISIRPIRKGQAVFIVIGEGLNEESIRRYIEDASGFTSG